MLEAAGRGGERQNLRREPTVDGFGKEHARVAKVLRRSVFRKAVVLRFCNAKSTPGHPTGCLWYAACPSVVYVACFWPRKVFSRPLTGRP